MTPNATYAFPLNDGGKTVTVQAHVEGKEQVKTPAGTFQTIRVGPEGDYGPLKNRGRIWIWYTDDAQHLPVQMRARLFWGTLTVYLTGVDSGSERRPLFASSLFAIRFRGVAFGSCHHERPTCWEPGSACRDERHRRRSGSALMQSRLQDPSTSLEMTACEDVVMRAKLQSNDRRARSGEPKAHQSDGE